MLPAFAADFRLTARNPGVHGTRARLFGVVRITCELLASAAGFGCGGQSAVSSRAGEGEKDQACLKDQFQQLNRRGRRRLNPP